jgi:HEAT repeat protein
MRRFAFDPGLAEKIATFLGDDDKSVREAAALTLLRLADPRTFDAMKQHLKTEKHEGVRLRLIHAMARSHPRKAMPFLIDRLAESKGRAVGVIAQNLSALSGQDLGLKAKPWKAWWKAQIGK